MKRLFPIAVALSLVGIAPASAQMVMGGDMAMGGQSCVMGDQFVPCPVAGAMAPGMMRPGMVQPGMMYPPEMAMEDEAEMQRPMTRREMRMQRRMNRQQAM